MNRTRFGSVAVAALLVLSVIGAGVGTVSAQADGEAGPNGSVESVAEDGNYEFDASWSIFEFSAFANATEDAFDAGAEALAGPDIGMDAFVSLDDLMATFDAWADGEEFSASTE